MNVNCIVTMGLVPEIKYLVSCILYLVSCILLDMYICLFLFLISDITFEPTIVTLTLVKLNGYFFYMLKY